MRIEKPTAAPACALASVAKEGEMGRVKEEPRGRLATLQDILADGGKRLVDQAQGLRVGIERRLVEVGRGVEGQVVALGGATQEPLTERLDPLLTPLPLRLRT